MAQERGDIPRSRRPSVQASPWLLLAVVTMLAYANAWPDVLVFDDREFLAGDRFDGLGPSDFIAFFSQMLWEAGASTTSLYRPLLLVSFGIENFLFDDWYAGYHLANILRHVLAVWLVFGLVRRVFTDGGLDRGVAQLVSMLAALIFAVHPVLSDAVVSVFNGASIYVTIFVAGGLWYLLANHQDQPFKAWLVAALCYFVALLYKESAASMPALAAIVLWLTSHEPWQKRLARTLAVLVLLLPLVAYLGMRAEALDDFDRLADRTSLVSSAQPQKISAPETTAGAGLPSRLAGFGLRFEPKRTAGAVSVWFDAFRLMIWPHPLVTLRKPSTTPLWIAAITQIGLLSLCLLAWHRKRAEPLLGLLFFYAAILPASRIIGEGALLPALSDRMLYLPSVGLTICLAALLAWLATRFRARVAIVAAASAVLLLLPVTWARNADWANEIGLLEHDFVASGKNGQILYALVRAHVVEGNTDRAIELCRENENWTGDLPSIAIECGKAFTQAGYPGSAEAAYLGVLQQSPRLTRTHFHLARLYVQMGRRAEAREHFQQAIDGEEVPFLRELMSGIMWMDLYPYDRARLQQARGHIERALELQPRSAPALEALEALEKRL